MLVGASSPPGRSPGDKDDGNGESHSHSSTRPATVDPSASGGPPEQTVVTRGGHSLVGGSSESVLISYPIAPDGPPGQMVVPRDLSTLQSSIPAHVASEVVWSSAHPAGLSRIGELLRGIVGDGKACEEDHYRIK